ncbi:outer membrane lipoprotein carrier protein LolA [Sphingobacterium sp. lm-10]|uniref:LolA family protein n=1 Tax=Sphingobacterium sp. lm-10 TaxID=2944904 RepID=UPI002020ECFB|nr:outer membrane lipoprotein carrier protein LolA [Sphingobacterium sp. lm-10]MCL7988880.1 outer membrane lipoprotein carrier protein LolA [Sphingobacterium sp. lm-10]
MKTISITRILLLALVSFNIVTAEAQTKAATAKATLDQVSKKYDSYRTMMVDFSFEATQADGQKYTDAGSLKLDKAGNKYRIKLNAQEIISDGKAVWSILPEDKEIQVSEVDNSSETLGPQNLFTFYRTGYTYAALADERVGSRSLKAIQLTPTDKSSSYAKIKLRVNSNNHIHDITVYDKAGSSYNYTVTALYVNQKIPQGIFNFQKNQFPNFEVVDLR